jgi:hypothetical protein
VDRCTTATDSRHCIRRNVGSGARKPWDGKPPSACGKSRPSARRCRRFWWRFARPLRAAAPSAYRFVLRCGRTMLGCRRRGNTLTAAPPGVRWPLRVPRLPRAMLP